jgi:hypothetical protein
VDAETQNEKSSHDRKHLRVLSDLCGSNSDDLNTATEKPKSPRAKPLYFRGPLHTCAKSHRENPYMRSRHNCTPMRKPGGFGLFRPYRRDFAFLCAPREFRQIED